ncbi:MAG TPA: DUF6510 family protein [Candidatus Acidoferrum sp.]|jgi:phage FluMu protein Com|nr:DUF6510 family protein [Candidatus Acidoferrum sp.]
MNPSLDDHLDGNAAAGDLSVLFALDVTVAEGRCAHCGATKRFADTRVYMRAPGLVVRCATCDYVLLRLARVGPRMVLDMRGMTRLSFDVTDS